MKIRHEIRNNDDGTPDEVLLYVDDRCVLHVEQMNDDHWWACLDGGGPTQVHLNWTSQAKIQLQVEVD